MKVGILMGSKSDYPIMKEAENILKKFNIEYEIKIVSAHRTPEYMYDYAKKNDVSVIIAGAGGAAHLPGMLASLTSKPVIGVPINATPLNGMDSLLSIVQMPKGVPVATVAINQSANAALLAIKMLAIHDANLYKQLDLFRNDLKLQVMKMELEDE
ncbi:MAG: 5-(carboxyamino)imidazole ribonucleotide mutase [Erysipelotrichales bacterium]